MTTNEMTTRELLSIVEAADALPMIEIRDCLIAAEKHDAVEALNNLCDQLRTYDMLKALEEMRGGMMTRLDRIEKRWERNQLMHDDCALLIAVGKAAVELIRAKDAEREADKWVAEAEDEAEWAVYDKMADEHAMETLRHSDALRDAVAPLLEEVME